MTPFNASQKSLQPDGGTTDLTVMIPAYREAEALKLLLPALKLSVGSLTPDYEIVIVDTETPLDDTEQVCRENKVIHVRQEGGCYGDAIRTGLRHTKGRYILCMDGDGSHNPVEIEKLWSKRQGRKLVIGSRYMPGGHTDNPRLLVFMSNLVNLVFRLAFHLQFRDVSNSLRLYQGNVFRSIDLQSDNFDIIPEVLVKICRLYGPETVLEVPISFEQRKKGESKRKLFAFTLTYIKTIMRLKRNTGGTVNQITVADETDEVRKAAGQGTP